MSLHKAIKWFVSAGLVASVMLVASVVSASAAEFDQFGFESVSAELSTHEAGAHPDFTTEIVMKKDPNSFLGEFPYASLKDVIAETPPGLLGNLNAVVPCAEAQFLTAAETLGEGCAFSAQVGIAELHFAFAPPGIYNKAPVFLLKGGDEDTVARLGFFVQSVPVHLDVHVRSGSDYGLIAESTNVNALASVLEVRTTLWGVPAASVHDNLRFTPLEIGEGRQESELRSAGLAPKPFLSNPTSCGGNLAVQVKADSYQEPGRFVEASAPLGEITDCDKVSFEPSLSLHPTTSAAASPSGIEAALQIPQDEEVAGRSTSTLRNTVIKLPEGLTISPGAADGLAACSEEQVGYHVSPPPPAHCPDASKIATAEIDSPSLSRTIQAAVYQRTPEPGHLTRAWLVADDLGVHVKIPGEFQLDPKTGQITSLFLETPQVPVREFRLHFKGGARGVLATPRHCGTYESEYSFEPWAGGGDVTGTTPMTFDSNCGVGGFAPQLEAGTVNPAAGAYSKLVTVVTQASGEANLSRLQVTMPQGVLAKLKGVELCSDSAAPSGNCPGGSRIGQTTVATGFGPAPLSIPQPGKDPTAVYLAGPYRGAPYSLVVDTPAQAGPFDLGDVVVRVALQVDPTTTQVTAVSDSLPQILEGIPITYRNVRLELDRPEFTLNPTSCDPTKATGEATSVEGATATLTSRFQALGCSRLAFKPKLKLSLKGKVKRAGNPALSATLTMPQHGANIDWNRVTLPKGLLIDNAHINNPCTRVQFNEGACPKKSILGTARAVSPLLGQPLSGPVYFRSNGGERELPDLVADLHGPIHVILVGFIDAKKERIRTTFASVPDAPVSKFQIKLYGGKRGLIQNGRNLCIGSRLRALIQFNGQNGKVADSQPLIGLPCSKKRKAKH